MTDQKEYNRRLIEEFRATRSMADKPLNGRPILLLTTTGAKTGLRRMTPMMYIPDGDRLLVIASNAGAPRHPDWYRNLVAHPNVTVEVGKETYDATAVVTGGSERQQLWTRIVELYPFFAEHQAKVTRQIPVIALERVAPQTSIRHDLQSSDEREVRALHQAWLDRWNKRNAGELAALVAEDGNLVGFDGSQINGQAEIEATMRQIFADHQTAAYVGIVRDVRFLTPDVAVLRAVVGMVPPGQSDINPAVNAIQTLVAAKQVGDGQWRIAVFQNTPAAFHGRPEMSDALTEELRQALRDRAPS